MAAGSPTFCIMRFVVSSGDLNDSNRSIGDDLLDWIVAITSSNIRNPKARSPNLHAQIQASRQLSCEDSLNRT
jgi:hypothetical protein